MIRIKCSVGELLDKLSILEVKVQMVSDVEKLKFITAERDELLKDSEEFRNIENINKLYYDLIETNKKLWVIEDDIRDCERNKDFGETFISLARSVYFTNDYRFKIKNDINSLTNSEIREQKDYKPY